MNTTFAVSVEIESALCRSQALSSFPKNLTHSSDLQVETICGGKVIIIGDAFDTDFGNSYENHAHGDPIAVLRQIVDKRWGRFVAIAYDIQERTIAIYRDPSGMVPCYYAQTAERISIATDARAIIEDSGINAPIDWKSLANCLLAPDRRRRETCLKGILEVLPGEIAIITSDQIHHDLLWRPEKHIGTRLDISFGQAVGLLECNFSNIIGTWCRHYPNPLVSLSGGFDSSAIAALASHCGPTSLLLFFAESPQADERRYAGSVANRLGLDLDAILCDPRASCVEQNLSAARPRPSARSFTQIFDKAAAKQGEAKGASAHFNGGGGDNVFGKLHSSYPLADRFLHSGLSRSLATTAFDICGATGASLPMVLRQAMAAVRDRARVTAWPDTTEMLSREAVDLRDTQLHPWLEAVKNCYPGQRQHVRNIARATASTDYLNIVDTLPTIYPILSQPLVEMCLSFPTWFWFTGGQDRSLARTVMKTRLPQDVLRRKLKGAFDGLVYQIIDLNRKRILIDLESGVLASQEMIDVKTIRAALDAYGANETNVIRVLHLHEVEMWCRHWC
ncbi:asparagine synthase-related protein [Sphingobium sp. SYK-6]|uniref:asparagine synthase-related protein n=1 Tax=Sphingobium sp. (strain NBRC 103272 / SYK-6) TaxID=627192 RepID=UPI0011D24B70|nr:asparagine synthetase B family protein [Sphingobium sp. SYK-6]